jgi:hypothetical protein
MHYHYSAHNNREEILSYGLRPKPAYFADNPDGVYMWDADPRVDTAIIDMGAQYDDTKGDLYQVDTSGLTLLPDRWLPMACYASCTIPPERITLVEVCLQNAKSNV